jgi:hypothetical protein
MAIGLTIFDNNLISTGQSVKLVSINGGEKTFRSKSKASEFLGRNNGYISLLLKRGVSEVDGYRIVSL